MSSVIDEYRKNIKKILYIFKYPDLSRPSKQKYKIELYKKNVGKNPISTKSEKYEDSELTGKELMEKFLKISLSIINLSNINE